MPESINALFVCSRNQWRSPTAEKVYCRRNLVNARSAGTSSQARRKVTEQDIRWADVIFVMEQKHLQRMRATFPQEMRHKEVHVLDIEDKYQFMDLELVNEIEVSVDLILNQRG